MVTQKQDPIIITQVYTIFRIFFCVFSLIDQVQIFKQLLILLPTIFKNSEIFGYDIRAKNPLKITYVIPNIIPNTTQRQIAYGIASHKPLNSATAYTNGPHKVPPRTQKIDPTYDVFLIPTGHSGPNFFSTIYTTFSYCFPAYVFLIYAGKHGSNVSRGVLFWVLDLINVPIKTVKC